MPVFSPLSSLGMKIMYTRNLEKDKKMPGTPSHEMLQGEMQTKNTFESERRQGPSATISVAERPVANGRINSNTVECTTAPNARYSL